jgi:hypothetical protein
MTRFFVSVKTVYSVDVHDSFLVEHKDSVDVLADHIESLFFAGDCQAVDSELLNFVQEESTGNLLEPVYDF